MSISVHCNTVSAEMLFRVFTFRALPAWFIASIPAIAADERLLMGRSTLPPRASLSHHRGAGK